jgi:hypothetical protein
MRATNSWRPAAALLAAFTASAGCTPVPTLRNVLAQHYAGYDQVLPASEALQNEARYEYLHRGFHIDRAAKRLCGGVLEQQIGLLFDQHSIVAIAAQATKLNDCRS